MRRLMRRLLVWLLLAPAAALAFPQLESSNSGELGSGNSGTAVMPGTIGPNDLLILCIALDGDDTINVAGWTRLWETVAASGSVSGTCFALDADGTEDGEIVNVTWTDTENGSYIVAAFSETFDGSPSSVSCSSNTQGSDTSNDPPAHNPAGWDVEDTTWLATTGYGFTHSVTAFPYAANNISVTHSGGGGAGSGWATLESAVASVDPGPFTTSGGSSSVNSTCAIRPAAASGGFWFWE